jgi:hypothetical protein
MSGNYGFWEYNGTNGLKGKESTREQIPDGRVVTVKDPTNPAVLEDSFIVYCLRTSVLARNDFCRLFPSLLPEEQERLTDIILNNPGPCKLVMDSQDFNDAIQQKEVTEGVRTRVKTRQPQIAAENRLVMP